MPGREVSTREIVLQALKDEKHVYVPYLHKGHVSKGKTMDMLKLHDRHDFESLVPDAWGIPSLSPDTVLQRSNALGGMGVPNEDMDGQGNFPTLDVIYMPAVAFDHSRQRLGHGKGFYDRYLHTYRTCLDAAQQGKNMPFLGKTAAKHLELANQHWASGYCAPPTNSVPRGKGPSQR